MYFLRTGVWPSDARSDVFRALPHIRCPILFITGQNDEICPPTNARLMYDAAVNPQKALLIVPNAVHDSTYAVARHLYEHTVVQFLQRVL
jgi:pimeloyl-ACP methyl ester carboxylesterase